MADEMTTARGLTREFYLRDAREVAHELLGKELVRESPEGRVSGRIVEAEAYLGTADRASHAFGGRPSRRTAILCAEGGRAYVHLISGVYWCLNITAREEGVAHSVLIRALEPLEGIDLMRRRRQVGPGLSVTRLADGPGKLCRALGVDGSLYGADLCGDVLYVRNRPSLSPDEIGAAPRVNVAYAGEAAGYEWRYFIRKNPCVSRP